MGANFGIVGTDWQQRVNWDRLREYRIERARQMMKKHGLGALLCSRAPRHDGRAHRGGVVGLVKPPVPVLRRAGFRPHAR
jgi:hypothetical protein